MKNYQGIIHSEEKERFYIEFLASADNPDELKQRIRDSFPDAIFSFQEINISGGLYIICGTERINMGVKSELDYYPNIETVYTDN